MSGPHRPYESIFKHPCDFKVLYRFYTKEEGGRDNLPHQYIRSDFWYEDETHDNKDRMYMIYPEFEDENGNLIESGAVHREGVARMWVVNPKWRAYHRQRVKMGTIGYFKEGFRTTGSCKVIEIVGLDTNPTE